MTFSFFSIILAALGLSFLVFIHELGHYIVARKTGMKVEVFSIGFGKPMISWMQNGVKWQICYLLFGGYVRIAGMEGEEGKDPHEIKGGFYSKKPMARILVALAGPIVNIVFAGMIFTGIWMAGGRLKPFEEFTKIIGWVDHKSDLASEGIKAGDTIATYNGEDFNGFKDLLYHGITSSEKVSISGEKVNYFTGTRTPYKDSFAPYQDPRFPKDIRTIGILSPASFIIFNNFQAGEGQFSPLADSGITDGDRLIWADGEVIFSPIQLQHIVNRDTALLTIDRGGKTMLVRVPRVSVGELKVSQTLRNEIVDWKRELGLSDSIRDLNYFPYAVDDQLTVQGGISYIDSDLIEKHSKDQRLHPMLDQPLQAGDRIVAIHGAKVTSPLELFSQLRSRQIRVIAQNLPKESISWKQEDGYFAKSVQWENLQAVINGIGVEESLTEKGAVHLLKPISPLTKQAFYAKKIPQGIISKQIETMSKDSTKYITLGSVCSDKYVTYNPTPIQEIKNSVMDIWRILGSLLSGNLSPKWLSGPVGIVKVMHEGWKAGLKEAFYWMALISLNLGVINLLPIPVLDGGHICFSIYEAVTKRRISGKMMERMVFPFVILLVAFFIYITFQDVTRLLSL